MASEAPQPQSYPIENPAVAQVLANVPPAERAGLLDLRQLIFDVAARDPDIGPLEETLKWGQPAYFTAATKSGTTLRLGLPKTGGFAMLCHCQTTVISDFRALFGDDFIYDGNRAVVFSAGETLPTDKIALLISAALRYHLK
ncbi:MULTISPECIES: DUF1801 domain-containing protein [Pacificibacter]|uniref:DUF1801 domain-containing protein n=1 Tax=Pacificibacter TaxID=1042323 RepID=UPI001C08464A|nr:MULTISPECIES: DUF1801 domain-containing protein [Pacificibacter]MBU2936583.1 DUF1801 domain-containing protein [Pacificibacter marinus]MDO6614614.1 DUF1801 domain-containing protein [Pacificibacter sp. 1_MG-2023]